jgi:hypothetical protein
MKSPDRQTTPAEASMTSIANTLAVGSTGLVEAVTVLAVQSTAPFAPAEVAPVRPNPNTRPDDPTIATPLLMKDAELVFEDSGWFD